MMSWRTAWSCELFCFRAEKYEKQIPEDTNKIRSKSCTILFKDWWPTDCYEKVVDWLPPGGRTSWRSNNVAHIYVRNYAHNEDANDLKLSRDAGINCGFGAVRLSVTLCPPTLLIPCGPSLAWQRPSDVDIGLQRIEDGRGNLNCLNARSRGF